MRREPVNKLGESALHYWKWSGFIFSWFYWIIPIGYMLAIKFLSWPKWIIGLLVLVCLIITFLKTFIFPKIIWERWRYEISEHEIDLCYGLWIRKRTIIPMVRVQHVDTKQGPLMNRFGLASVTISTAAGSHEIPALKEEVADELRDHISILARVVEEDV